MWTTRTTYLRCKIRGRDKLWGVRGPRPWHVPLDLLADSLLYGGVGDGAGSEQLNKARKQIHQRNPLREARYTQHCLTRTPYLSRKVIVNWAKFELEMKITIESEDLKMGQCQIEPTGILNKAT